eukprot:238972-Hanusia_phi.AAC.1
MGPKNIVYRTDRGTVLSGDTPLRRTSEGFGRHGSCIPYCTLYWQIRDSRVIRGLAYRRAGPYLRRLSTVPCHDDDSRFAVTAASRRAAVPCRPNPSPGAYLSPI